MSVVTRTAQGSDEEVCLGLIAELNGRGVNDRRRAVFRLLLTTERGEVFVAESGGEVVGVATVSYNLAIRYAGEYCQLEELMVSPRARGIHAGGHLLQAAIAGARNRGCEEMGLYLTEVHLNNQPFYEKYGFALVGPEMRQPLR